MNIDQSFPRTSRLLKNMAHISQERGLRGLFNLLVCPLGMPAFEPHESMYSVLDRMEQFLRVRNLPVNYDDE